MQIELTMLTTLITEDSAKQLVNSPQLTVNSWIGQLGERNISYFLPADKLLGFWQAQIYRIFQKGI